METPEDDKTDEGQINEMDKTDDDPISEKEKTDEDPKSEKSEKSEPGDYICTFQIQTWLRIIKCALDRENFHIHAYLWTRLSCRSCVHSAESKKGDEWA